MRKRAPIRRWGDALGWRLAACIGALSASPSGAHESLPVEITQATRAIDADPHNASLYLHRAELFRLHSRWQAALHDYGRAEALAPGFTAAVLGRASLQLDWGRPRDALATLDALPANERSASFWELKSRAHETCGEAEAALLAQARYLGATPRAAPGDILRRARLGIAAGEAASVVLAQLDAGIARVGPAPALQQLAIELDVQLGDYDRALSRLGAVGPHASVAAAVLARRGDILLLAKRPLAARAAYTEALDQLQTLAPDRRSLPPHRALEARLRSLLNTPLSTDEGHANH